MNKAILPRIYLLTAGLLGLLFAVLQGILYIRYYDHEVLTYAHDCLPATLAHTGLAVAALAALSAVLLKNGLPTELPTPKRAGSIASIALCLAAFGGYALMSLAGALTKRELVCAYTTVFQYLLPIGALCGVLYVAVQLRSAGGKQTTTALCGLGLVIFCVLFAFNLFYDKTTPLTDPRKVLHQMAMLSAALYFLSEIRYRLTIAKPKWYLIASAWALLLLPTASVGMLIAILAGIFPLTADAAITVAIEAALYLWVLLRAVSAIRAKPPKQA